MGEDNSVTKMMEEKAKLEADVAQKAEQILGLESYQSSLKAKIASLENDMLKEKDDIERLKHENDKLKDEKSQMERKIGIHAEKEKNFEQEKTSKDTLIETLKASVETFKKDLNTKVTEITKLQETSEQQAEQLKTADQYKKQAENALKYHTAKIEKQ